MKYITYMLEKFLHCLSFLCEQFCELMKLIWDYLIFPALDTIWKGLNLFGRAS